MIFRLTVDDYHRYCYVADGVKEDNVFIPGVLHTVNPLANDYFPIYKENSREYSVLHTKEFGDIVGQDSLTRFDNKKKKKRKGGKGNNNDRNQNGQNENRKKQDNSEKK